MEAATERRLAAGRGADRRDGAARAVHRGAARRRCSRRGPTTFARSAGVPRASPHGAPRDAVEANGSAFILVAEDLGPADVAEHGERACGHRPFRRRGDGACRDRGALARHSHDGARGPELLQVGDGASVVVDGSEGDGDARAVPRARGARGARPRTIVRARARARSPTAPCPADTTDGHRVRVLVNAATPAELRAGLAAGAEGAGLIRTELAFLDAPAWPQPVAARADASPAPRRAGRPHRHGAGARLRRRQGAAVPARRAAPRNRAAAGPPRGLPRAARGDRGARRPGDRCASCSPWSGRRSDVSAHARDAHRPSAPGAARGDDRATRGGRGGDRNRCRVPTSSASARTTSPTPRSGPTASRTARRLRTTRACCATSPPAAEAATPPASRSRSAARPRRTR